ncbi:MAG: hypothetical protein A2V66_10360, partial [Ignavibacteria bacterium RBG_13_36_8]
MKLVFFGTPDYVVPIVDGLLKHFRTNANPHPISAVITQAPKPSGREQFMAYSPVDEWAYNKKIPKFFDPMDLIKENIFADIGVLASYGQFIPDDVINHFKYGILNIHPSLLPLWRGASPIQASIISGDVKTGVSIIKLDDKLDHGPIVSQFKDEVLDSDTTETLRKRLFERSAEVIPGLIEAYVAGKITPKNQDEEKVTFTRQIKKEDAFIPPEYLSAVMQGATLQKEWGIPWIKVNKSVYSLQTSAHSVNNFIRAMDPWPRAWSNIKISRYKDIKILRIKILKAHVSIQQLTTNNPQL